MTWTIIATVALAAAVFVGGYRVGKLDCEADHHAQIDVMRARVDKANYDAALAGFRYEEWKDRHYMAMEQVAEDAARAAKASPDWARGRLPAGVRDAARRATGTIHRAGKSAAPVPAVRAAAP